MIYRGEFRDLQNQLYRVVITTEGSNNQTRTVTLGGTPFVTAMDADSESIYSPAKYQSATVNIITPDYNFDIYSSKAQGTKVELQDAEGGIIWTGYVTPNLYDMGFVEEREEVEIECIDALSTLQYIKYSADAKKVVSFLDIIRELLQSCKAYESFYITNNIQLTKDGTDTILEKLYIAEENFFDTKKDKETDEDVAWTMQEVLEEICQYLGVTVVADGADVYFIDYDAIKAGRCDYYKYAVDADVAPTLHTLSFTKTITAADYSGTDGSLSLDNVYNKVTVSDDLFTYDTFGSELPSLSEYSKAKDTIMYFHNGIFSSSTSGSVGKITPIKFLPPGYPENIQEHKCFNVYVAYKNCLQNSQLKLPIYKLNYGLKDGVNDGDWSYKEVDPQSFEGWSYRNFNRYAGVAPVQYDVTNHPYKEDNGYIDNKISLKDSFFVSNGFCKLAEVGSVDSVQFRASLPDLKLLEYTEPNIKLSAGEYIIIGGEFSFYTYASDMLPIAPTTAPIIVNGQLKGADDYFAVADKCKVKMMVKFGDKYFNGTEWVNEISYCDVPLEYTAEKKAFGTVYNIKSNANWMQSFSKDGYSIPVPEGLNIADLTISLYSTKGVTDDAVAEFILINNLGFFVERAGDILSDDEFSDTVYTNIINDRFVAELDEIKFRICTWDNKKPNYSAVAYKLDDAYRYLDKTFNNACYDGEQSWTSSDDEAPSAANGLRQEEHLIYKLVNQYSSPSIILNLSLRNDNKIYGCYRDTTITQRDFIIDTINIDFKNNKADIKLIEKK